jgi:RNA polymerase-binding protein DksA
MAIDTLRGRLLERRRSLLDRVGHLAEDLRSLDENVAPEIEEESQERSLERVLAGLDDRGREEIATVDRALGLIARGDYGRCEDCGEEIPMARLEALPTATTCVTCAENRDRIARLRAVIAGENGGRSTALDAQDTPTDGLDLPAPSRPVRWRSRKRPTTATRS